MKQISTAVNGAKLDITTRQFFSKLKSFGAESLEDYQSKLKHMNLAEIVEHALKMGLRPNSDRKRAERTLIEEFKKTKAIVVNAEKRLERSQASVEIQEPDKAKKTTQELLAFLR